MLDWDSGWYVFTRQGGWEDDPPAGIFAKYFGGILFPLIFAAYGGWCIITHPGILFGEHNSLDVSGSRAVALGIAAMGLGLFLHSHYFWGNVFQGGVDAGKNRRDDGNDRRAGRDMGKGVTKFHR